MSDTPERKPEQLVLPTFDLPPSVNTAYSSIPFLKRGAPRVLKGFKDVRTWVGARKVLSRDGETYKQGAAKVMNETGATTNLREFVQRHVTVDVWMYVYQPNWLTLKGQPNRIAGDEDNRIKLLKDVIFDCIGIDDCASFFTGIRKMHGAERKVVVVITATPDVVDEF